MSGLKAWARPVQEPENERGVEASLAQVLQTAPEPGWKPLEWLPLSTPGIEEFFRVLHSGA